MFGFLAIGLSALATAVYYLMKPASQQTSNASTANAFTPITNQPVPGLSNVSNTTTDPTADQLHYFADATLIPVPPQEKWVRVDLPSGASYLVAPWYIAPVGIGEAQKIATLHQATLPTPELVDAIYNQADLKLAASPRDGKSKPPSDYTAKTMNSPEANANQESIIFAQMLAKNPNLDFRLMAGPYKDVVVGGTREVSQFENKSLLGHIGIYGWQQANGKPIQQFMWGHNPDWKDYSQGLRLVRKIA